MKTLHLTAISVSMFFTLFVTSQAYAPCIEGPEINCNNYPPQALSQIKSDKLNYETQDKPVITIIGVPSTITHLEIDDSSSNIMFEHDLTLPSNGTARYVLDISYYKYGGYSATATSLVSKVTTGFTVGMTSSGGRMTLSVDKNSYLPGDQVSILGTGNSNTLIQLSLIDPNGTSITSAKVYSDKTGHFTSSNFTIPINAVSGVWQVAATGGMMHVHTPITINSTLNNYSGINTDKIITPSPLKQFKSGIVVDDIKCNQNLHLIIKAKDNSPACVKLNVAYMLIKREWATSESAYPGGDRQFTSHANSTIIPAHMPRSSGLRITYYESSRVINYSGFGVYNETFPYRGTQNDYILKPGNTGVMTFKINAMVSEPQDQSYPTPLPKSLNLTNYAIFYHEITSLKDLSKYPGVTTDGSGYDFSECSTGPAGERSCIGEQFGGTGPIEAFVTDHPGIDVLFEPPSEVLPLSMNATSKVVTLTITADSDASRGTYLVVLPGIGLDSFLLTVGDRPYHE